MAVLWLVQVARWLSPNHGLEFEFRDQIQAILTRWASWQFDKYPVSWATNVAHQHPSTTDCVVYFVDGFDSGFVRSLAQGQQTPLIAAASDPFNYSEFGLTAAGGGGPHCSEVHIGKCLFALRRLRRNHEDFTERERRDYPLLLAGVALHEAMHNKVEPEMGAGWHLHDDGGGGVAGALSFGPMGQLLTREPTEANLTFLHDHFASQHAQFIPPR